MPTKRQLTDYEMGYRDGYNDAEREVLPYIRSRETRERPRRDFFGEPTNPKYKKKRKLSAWNKFVKANSKKPRFRLRSGKLNLKKLGVAFRKTPAGRKRKR